MRLTLAKVKKHDQSRKRKFFGAYYDGRWRMKYFLIIKNELVERGRDVVLITNLINFMQFMKHLPVFSVC